MTTVIEECDLCGKGIEPVTVNSPCIVMCAECSAEVHDSSEGGKTS